MCQLKQMLLCLWLKADREMDMKLLDIMLIGIQQG